MADTAKGPSEPVSGGGDIAPILTLGDGFKAIGPDPIGKKKKKYKFVEPPGISTWIFSFAKKCLACACVYAFGYFRV